jgi:gluconolactonase
VKLDRKGKVSVAYSGTNTGGSLAMNSKGVLFLANRGLNPSVEELSPKRQTLASKMNDDPLDCIGGVLNDIVADSRGGVYFTMGGVFYSDPTGKVTRYGENLATNGIILSADEKRLYVTNGPTVASFDVQPDGSLTNQHEFAKLEGGGNGDGSTFDAAGRIYVSSNPGVQVISPDGKYLGLIPTPRALSVWRSAVPIARLSTPWSGRTPPIKIGSSRFPRSRRVPRAAANSHRQRATAMSERRRFSR